MRSPFCPSACLGAIKTPMHDEGWMLSWDVFLSIRNFSHCFSRVFAEDSFRRSSLPLPKFPVRNYRINIVSDLDETWERPIGEINRGTSEEILRKKKKTYNKPECNVKISRRNYGRNPRETLIEILQKSLGEVPGRMFAEISQKSRLKAILENHYEKFLKVL